MTEKPDHVVAVDLGGTKTTAALVTATGDLHAVRTVTTPAADGPAAVLDTVAELVHEVASGEAYIQAVGVGTAGLVDVNDGIIVSATEAMPGWAGTHVVDELASRLGARWQRPLSVHVQNDVDAHAAGEAWRGAGRGRPCVLMVTVGTGVGASVVLDGTPRYGSHSAGGEIGHAPTPGAEGLRCPCGRTGHLEAVAAGPAIARRYHHATGLELTGREVTDRGRHGDETAARLTTEAATALGRALAGQITVLDPDVVVIGGGVADAGPLWWDPMRATLQAELIPVLQGTEIVAAALGANAALLGAARAAHQLLDRPSTSRETWRTTTPPSQGAASSEGRNDE